MRKFVILAGLLLVLYCPAGENFRERGPVPSPSPPPKAPAVSSRGDQLLTMTVEASAYVWTGKKTFTGTWPQPNHTVAVDPKVIPLGSRVYIEGLGWRVAEDTGGVIRGNKIDVFMADEAEAIQFGRRTLVVKIERR